MQLNTAIANRILTLRMLCKIIGCAGIIDAGETKKHSATDEKEKQHQTPATQKSPQMQ